MNLSQTTKLSLSLSSQHIPASLQVQNQHAWNTRFKHKISWVKLQQLISRIWGVGYMCLNRQPVYCKPIPRLSCLVLSHHFLWQCSFRNSVKIHTIPWKREPSKSISTSATRVKQASKLRRAVCTQILDMLIPRKEQAFVPTVAWPPTINARHACILYSTLSIKLWNEFKRSY